ncbi:universal stress protein [Streptomyces ruber]|uniref:Universal stress protein n=2 Tax=Streptomyces TaxID=1883 RepID=A0A918BDJ6_9ACTN|nr:universal stress protein [Streptomyces ruber]GGQ59356.1 universal stress protein [Streptomyces ruber]
MTRPISVGVDGTPESRAAAAWGAREAVRRGMPLRLVHAWERQARDPVVATDPETQEQWARQALRDAEEAVRAEHDGLDLATEFVTDGAVDALIAEADGAGMLVLGSRGHGAVVGFLLGSVGQQVIARATRPVVLVRSGDRAEAEAVGREIVVGQHGSPEDSAGTLRFAFETAAARGAPLRAVRAWNLPPVFGYSPGSLRLADEAGGLEPYEKKALAEALRPWRERFPEVRVAEHVEIGSAGQVLLSVAGNAQLMVAGRRAHRRAIGTRIGSVAHALVHHAPCPVAVVPPS